MFPEEDCLTEKLKKAEDYQWMCTGTKFAKWKTKIIKTSFFPNFLFTQN